ncbi:MAG: metallophosphoesterase family protein [Candidatus Atribacteria bacterium]|nr:metallophosphoesterase family protein [Candidatus Atribacteria bacterium]
MTRIAIFSDIHGNITALEAVLSEIEKMKVAHTICLGDLVGYNPFPNEVIERIRSLGIPTTMGNYDQGVGFELDDCGCAYRNNEERIRGHISLSWTKEQVTPENKAFLRNLLPRYELEVGPFHFLFVHGSPRRINEYLFPERPDESFRHMMSNEKANVLLCGHTHIPFFRKIDHFTVVNDGSVGLPKDGDWRACFALLTAEEILKINFYRIPYNREHLKEGYHKHPELPFFAEKLMD